MTLGEFEPPVATNVSFVFIDDTKSIDNLNITLTTLKAMQNLPIFLPHFFQKAYYFNDLIKAMSRDTLPFLSLTNAWKIAKNLKI